MTANATRLAGDALPALNEIVGLPHAAPPEELGRASEQRFNALFRQASDGDCQAQGELVRLRLAYLNWAYADKAA
jgi:hypothetical protein